MTYAAAFRPSTELLTEDNDVGLSLTLQRYLTVRQYDAFVVPLGQNQNDQQRLERGWQYLTADLEELRNIATHCSFYVCSQSTFV